MLCVLSSSCVVTHPTPTLTSTPFPTHRLGPALGYVSADEIAKLSAPSASGLHAGAVTQLLEQASTGKLPLSSAQCAMLQPEVAARVNGKTMGALTKDAKIALTCENKVSRPGCSCAPAVVDIVVGKSNGITVATINALVLEAAKRTGQSVCSQGAAAQGCASPSCLSVNAIVQSKESFSDEEDASLAYTAVRVSAVNLAKAFEFKTAFDAVHKSAGENRLLQQQQSGNEVEVTVVDMSKDGKAVNTTPLAASHILMFFGIACAAAGVAAIIVYVAFTQMVPNAEDKGFVELNKRAAGAAAGARSAELALSVK